MNPWHRAQLVEDDQRPLQSSGWWWARNYEIETRPLEGAKQYAARPVADPDEVSSSLLGFVEKDAPSQLGAWLAMKWKATIPRPAKTDQEIPLPHLRAGATCTRRKAERFPSRS